MLPALRRLSAVLLTAVLLASLAAVVGGSGTASARALPTKQVWKADVRTVMAGADDYLAQRAADAVPGEQLAINLDIDNTSLQTEYAKGRPVRPTLRFAKQAKALGMAVFFNTGRRPYAARGVAAQLTKVGFPVDQLCTRVVGETLIEGKQRCRSSFVEQGFTLVANVGNNPTDFTGGDYERSFALPNYRGQLG
jgi:hypothetical protein